MLSDFGTGMKNWAWLLPCWVWKYFFAQFPKERVLLDGRTRFLIRLDEEFALVYDPQGKVALDPYVAMRSAYYENRAESVDKSKAKKLRQKVASIPLARGDD